MNAPLDGLQLAPVEYDPFADAPLARAVPTTEPQREIWLASQLSREASLAYNESVSLRMRGPLDPKALHGALQDLVDRHDSLRATFSDDGQSLLLTDNLLLEVTLSDRGDESAEAQARAVSQAQRDAVAQPFDLERGPLLRAQVLRLGETDHLLVLTTHHIVCDGWSFGVMVPELSLLYAVRIGAADQPLAQAATFAAYALDQVDEAGSAQREADTAYWVSLFDRSQPVLDLPSDRPRQSVRTFHSCREDLLLDRDLVDAVRRFGARQGASLFATMFSLFAALLGRLARADDVTVGVAAAGQAIADAPALVGHCVNLLPIRVAVDPEESVASLLRRTSTVVLDAYDHQQCTFGSVLKKLQLPRDPARLPLVSVLFNLDSSIDTAAMAVRDLHFDLTSNPRAFENFDLYLNASQIDGSVMLECQYNTDLFDAATIARWLALYRAALERAVVDPTLSVAAVLAPTSHEAARVAGFNRTERPYESDLRLGDLLLRGMRATPDRTALVFESRELSFGDLERLAWGVAAALRERGIQPSNRVGVYLERSIDMVVALVGVVFSGAAYVPLDPSLPAARLDRMADDAALACVLTRRKELDGIGPLFGPGRNTVLLDDIASAEPLGLVGTPQDTAYVIFTSGSTGRPKGAMNAHVGIVNRLLWMQEAYALRPDDRVMQKTPFTFDVSVWEFFWPLATGATLVIARPEGHRDGEYLVELVQRERISVMHFVPSMLRLFLAQGGVPSCRTLRRVVCSGEALPLDLVDRFFELLPAVPLANLYGPTEAAVDVTAWECKPHDRGGFVPIGAPIANTAMHVLDEKLRPLPLGVAGDLYIAGVQVGMGYVGRPDLTTERFLADPFSAGGGMYKTGDVARWRDDGSLIYLGRADFQVKLRGYRIELGEIEAELHKHPDIAAAVVVTREDQPGDVRLVGYGVSRAGKLNGEAVREFLRRSLPDYMIPQHLLQLESIPLLTSGKVDRKALPRPDAETTLVSLHRLAPRTELEREVLEAMEQVLSLPGMGIHDDFFALGGHSLLAARLTARLNKDLDIRLTLNTIFKAPTAEGLARAVMAARCASMPQRERVTHDGTRSEAPLTLMQERIRFMEQMHPGRVVYNTPSAHRLTGPFDRAAFESALRMMVERQPSLRTQVAEGTAGPVQRVLPQVEFELPLEDLSELPAAEREAELMRRLQAIVDRPIAIDRAPLFRVALYRMAPNEHVFLFMPHHIIWDGWSFDLLYRELAELLPAAQEGRRSTLPALPVNYLDYAQWHARWMLGDDCRSQIAYWKHRYTGVETPRAVPTVHPRRPGMTGVGAVEWVHIDKPLTERLRQVAVANGVTLNMLLMAIYAAMLSQLAGSQSLVLGIPVRGRLASEVEAVMGFFNNLLPTHLMVQPALTLPDWLAVVKRELLDAFANQEVPFERLATEPELAGPAQKAGLYQSLFSFQDARDRERHWGPLSHAAVLVMQKGATEDLGLWLMEVPSGLEGGINYNADLFDRATARLFRDRLVALLERVADRPGATLQALVDIPGDDTQRVGDWIEARNTASSGDRDGAPSRVGMSDGPASGAPQYSGGAAGSNALEGQLAQIWARLLGIDASQIAGSDNFFDLGGSSLLAMRAVAEAESLLGTRMDPSRYVYENMRQLSLPGKAIAAPAEVRAAAATEPESKGLISRVLGRFGRQA